jgi:hypothetical protein
VSWYTIRFVAPRLEQAGVSWSYWLWHRQLQSRRDRFRETHLDTQPMLARLLLFDPNQGNMGMSIGVTIQHLGVVTRFVSLTKLFSAYELALRGASLKVDMFSYE